MILRKDMGLKTQRAGFTLAEMLVTVAIISLISTMVVAGYRSGQKRYTLQAATQQTIADLRRAQNIALAPSIQSNYQPGVGISFNLAQPDLYTFFIDNSVSNDKAYGWDDKVMESGQIKLPAGVEIKNIILTNLSPSNKADVFFEPPDPITYINGKCDPGVATTIILELAGENLTKNIIIKTSGLIE